MAKAGKILGTWAILLALAACGRRASTERRPPSLRLLSYNVYVGNPDLAATAAQIRAAGADIVVLQETTPALATVLRRDLAGDYPYMDFHTGPLGNGPGVLARTAPTGARYLPSMVGMNGSWTGTFMLDGRPIQIVDVHLHPSPITSANPIDAKRAYDDAERVRVAQIDELRALLAPEPPAILLGDFNSLPSSPTFARCDQLGWRDGLAGTAAATTPTYHFRGLGFRIDHILVPDVVIASEPSILPQGTSDHVPIAVTVAWRP